jgi:membrane protein
MLNISGMEHTFFATVVGIGTILFGATSVFISIQDGLNVAWGLRPKPKIFALKFFLNRLLSFAMVLSIGFIMLVSLIVDAMLVLFQDFWVQHLPGDALRFIAFINRFFSAMVITVIFLLVYRFLPSGKAKLKFLIPGSLISMTLFVLGKYLIGIYLGNSSPGTAYGAAGSLVVLLIWVFYSSIVLLYGAQLIQALVRSYGGEIMPDVGAVKIVTREVAGK